MNNLLEIASSQIGVKEISGSNHNQTIVNYAKDTGFEWINDDETPWCSIFMNWCAQKAKLSSSKKANARSWLTVGMPVNYPEPGDVVIFWRGSINSWQGHVGIFMGYDQAGERIYTLGGNQGNQVSITAYPKSKLLGFRRLSAASSISLPQAPLKKGDTGEEVKKLQDSLKLIGFNPGTSDGIFGEKTAAAIIQMQATGQLETDGVYGENTASLLSDLLAS